MTALHEIGTMLRTYRKRQGLTASELAQKSGIHRNTLSALERGHGNVELNTLLAICEQLELDLSLVPARVASVVRHEAFVRSLPLIRRTAFTWPVDSDKGKLPTPSTKRQRQARSNSETDNVEIEDSPTGNGKKPQELRGGPKLRVNETSMSRKRIAAGNLNSSFPTYSSTAARESEVTPLQRRVNARLAMGGIGVKGTKK
jgi:transcriptional regulator with XRE-family HTH domain